MDDQEQALADDLYRAIQMYTTHDERGMQAKRYRVGISDLGYCSERTRRMLAQEDPDDSDMYLAFIGTALGDHFEKAVKKAYGSEVLIQPTCNLVLTSDTHTYEIPGHPDIVFPHKGMVLDGKTARGLSLAERNGADRQKRYQRHGYAKGLWQDGVFGDIPLEEILVGNVWMDRAGDDKRLHVELEPFSEDVIFEATEWLEEVILAFTSGEPARKEPPREVCEKTCGFFSTCRAYDSDVQGLLTDEVVLSAIAQYQEGQDLASVGRRLQEQAKAALEEIDGYAIVDGQRYQLRHTHINETVIPEQRRRGYDKISLKKV